MSDGVIEDGLKFRSFGSFECLRMTATRVRNLQRMKHIKLLLLLTIAIDRKSVV